MRETFKKQNLKTGDIVVLNNGDLGVVILETNTILYQYSGCIDLESVTDDLRIESDGEEQLDIAEVYRGDGYSGGYSPLGFLDYEDGDPVYVRADEEETDPNMDEAEMPSAGEMKKPWEMPEPIRKQKETPAAGEMPDAPGGKSSGEENPEDSRNSDEKAEQKTRKEPDLGVIVQAYHGNRTFIKIYPYEIEAIIHGYKGKDPESLSSEFRTIVRIPNTENLVIIYDRNREEYWRQNAKEALEKGNYVVTPLAEIPELDLVLYSRCIVCRMNEEGGFESLQQEDLVKFKKYLAI